MVNMVIENEQTKITKEDEKKLQEFPLSDRDYLLLAIKYKLESIIYIAENMLAHTKKELVNYFTYDEVKILIDISNIYQYKSNVSPKNFLILLLQDEVNVDKRVILNKLYKLTEFQMYTVLTMCSEFFNAAIQDKNNIDILKRVFQITDEVNINFYLHDELTYQIKSYLVNKTDLEHTKAISLCDMITHTKRELLNYFTTQEAILIVGTTITLMYSGLQSPKNCLINGTQYSIKYEGIDIMYNVDKETILNKLYKLTEFQSYTVLTMCFEAWTLRPFITDYTEQIRLIFQITTTNEEVNTEQ